MSPDVHPDVHERGRMQLNFKYNQGVDMKCFSRMVLPALCAVTVLTAACVPSRYGGVNVEDGGVSVNVDGVHVNVNGGNVTVDEGNELPPALPYTVELGPDRQYRQSGYDYYYHGERWQYSRDRGESWSDLPRSHWPNEIRRRGDWR